MPIKAMPNRRRVSIATCRLWPDLGPSLKPLVDALARTGVTVVVRPWQSGADAFSGSDLVLPLAAWDYAGASNSFLLWLREITKAGGRFANDSAMMAWNMDKRYLLDLETYGIRVPPSFFLKHAEPHLLKNTMQALNWPKAVLKPAIGQSGNGVQLLDLMQSNPWPITEGPQLLQPWLEEIEMHGELSMVFLEGGFSHAVRRQPPKGEWRANTQYGVSVRRVEASPSDIEAGRNCLLALPQIPLYARVDGLSTSRGLVITELELIEPALFLNLVPNAAARMAVAIERRLDNFQRRAHRI